MRIEKNSKRQGSENGQDFSNRDGEGDGEGFWGKSSNVSQSIQLRKTQGIFIEFPFGAMSRERGRTSSWKISGEYQNEIIKSIGSKKKWLEIYSKAVWKFKKLFAQLNQRPLSLSFSSFLINGVRSVGSAVQRICVKFQSIFHGKKRISHQSILVDAAILRVGGLLRFQVSCVLSLNISYIEPYSPNVWYTCNVEDT